MPFGGRACRCPDHAVAAWLGPQDRHACCRAGVRRLVARRRARFPRFAAPPQNGRPPGRGARLRPARTRAGGAELHVETSGPADGPPVVLTHGWGLDAGEWCYAREQLARDHRVIAWDLPGLGQSGRPLADDWSLEKLAGDLDAVLALAGDRPAVLAGHSIGGMIVLTHCKLFPASAGRRVAGARCRTPPTPTRYERPPKPGFTPCYRSRYWSRCVT